MFIEEFCNEAIKYGLNMRLVDENDAERIIQLRTDSNLSKHIHSTDKNLNIQKTYIKEYKLKESTGKEYYFAFSLLDSKDPIGFYRIYNIDYNTKTFTIGSWIFDQNVSEKIPIIADILIRDFGFNQLRLETCLFDVRRKNTKVLKYHMLFSPIFIEEDYEGNKFFYLKKNVYFENKNKILKFLI